MACCDTTCSAPHRRGGIIGGGVMLVVRRIWTSSEHAVFREAPEGGYVAFVEELPGPNTQGDTLDEARANLREAVELVLEANRALSEEDLVGQTVIRERCMQKYQHGMTVHARLFRIGHWQGVADVRSLPTA